MTAPAHVVPAVAVHDRLLEAGFAFLHAADTRAWLARHGEINDGAINDWPVFTASWNGMALDRFMADGGRYRRRRYAVFSAGADGTVTRQPHQPHYQTTSYNKLNGGIQRWFEPIPAAVADGTTLRTVLAACHGLFNALTPSPEWHIEVHQFRIEARTGETGQPTPEGAHRDGVDWVLVLMIDRQNIASGRTTITDLDRRERGSFTLTEPLDAALVDDNRAYHGVTAVEPLDPSAPAHRDVLVVTFRRRRG